MSVLTLTELDVLARTLFNNRSQVKESFAEIQRVCTQMLFQGCESKIVRQYCATNLNHPKGNFMYGIIRSVMLDQKITEGGVRNLLKIVIFE